LRLPLFQHLANLDYLIPFEYIDTLQELFDSAPISSYDSVRQVIMEELGKAPEELFDNFSVEPIASASLAQVHVAYDKVTGKKLAIKVQHKGLRETSQGDLFAVCCAVRAADYFFKDFTLGVKFCHRRQKCRTGCAGLAWLN
jgi:aarF domain-containing kinase